MKMGKGLAVGLALVTGLGALSTGCGASSANSGGPTEPMRAPVLVRVTAGRRGPGAGEMDMLVDIDVRSPGNYAADLRVWPPAGGQLLAGAPAQRIPMNRPGVQRRVFHIRTNGPLQQNNPFRVELRASNTSGGFIAKRAFPAPAEVTVPRHHGPRPPGGRPPGR